MYAIRSYYERLVRRWRRRDVNRIDVGISNQLLARFVSLGNAMTFGKGLGHCLIGAGDSNKLRIVRLVKPGPALHFGYGTARITSYNVCYTKLLRCAGIRRPCAGFGHQRC